MNLLSFFDNTAQVYVIEADDFIKPGCTDLSTFLSILSDEERNRFYKYKNEKAQFTFLTARVYLRVLLSNIISEQKSWITTQSSTARNDDKGQLDARPSILRTRLVPSEFIRRKKFSETAEENKVEQASCPLLSKWITTQSSTTRNDDIGQLDLKIEISTSGKPYLTDYPNLFFNLSHTDNLILIAISNSPVGVDVEKNERNADKDAIIKHFFTEKEQQSFFSQPDELRQLSFVKGWTRKEAILKATGEGLSAMKKYEVSFEPETDNPIFKLKTDHNFKVKDFTPKEGYVACLAVLNISMAY